MSTLAQPLVGGAGPAVQTSDDCCEVHAAAAARFVHLVTVRPAGRFGRRRLPSMRSRANPADSDQVLSDLPCRHDPALWFAEAPADLERAKALCGVCPVRLACLAVAVDRAEYAGVWGGHIFERGKIILRKRPRGRPRKRDGRPAVAAPPPSIQERDRFTHSTWTPEWTSQRHVHTAAARMYDAECALHAAHQSHLDAWINAANENLHDAVAEYLAALAG